MKKRTKVLLVILGCPIALVGLGYLSSIVSRKSCENKVARWIVEDQFEGKRFCITFDNPRVKAIFIRVGADFKIFPDADPLADVENTPPDPTASRIADVREALVYWPFLVDIPYTCGLPSGEGWYATKRFVCFFGLAFEVREYGKEDLSQHKDSYPYDPSDEH